MKKGIIKSKKIKPTTSQAPAVVDTDDLAKKVATHLGSLLDEDAVASKVVAAIQPQVQDMISKTIAAVLANTQQLSSIPLQIGTSLSSAQTSSAAAVPSTPSSQSNTSMHISPTSAIDVPLEADLAPQEASLEEETNYTPQSLAIGPVMSTQTSLPSQQTSHSTLSSLSNSSTRATFGAPITENMALQEIRRLLGNSSATWTCGGQKLAVMSTLNSKTDVVSILATGSGKTMQVLLPAILHPRQASVVVLPLKALVQDYSRRLTNMKIPFEVWSTPSNQYTPLQGNTNLIIALMDQVQKPIFKQVITHYHDHSGFKVARWIFDEAHYSFTANNYRPSFQHLDELRAIMPAQFILMSGTIPPHTLDLLKNAYALTPSVEVIRTNSARPELQYIVTSPVSKPAELWEQVTKRVTTYTSQFRPEDRGLIYCDTLQTVKHLQEKLQLPVYQGGSSTDKTEAIGLEKTRKEAYEKWTVGSSKWMICTSAFAAGCDNPHVRVVIMAGTPAQVVDTEQEMDRAGRDKLHALAIIIPWRYHTIPRGPQGKYTGVQEMHTIVYTVRKGREGCIRYGLTHFNDGVGTACTDLPGAELCSKCQPVDARETPRLTLRPHQYSPALLTTSIAPQKRTVDDVDEDNEIAEAHQASKKRKAERTQALSDSMELLLTALKFFQNSCSGCWYYEAWDEAHGHCLADCKQLPRDEVVSVWVWKKNIKYLVHPTSTMERPNICFKCGIPQIHEVHDTFVAGPNKCPWEDIVIPLAYFITMDPDDWAAIKSHFKQDWKDEMEYAEWLGQCTTAPFPNSIWVFIWYYQ